MRTLSTIKRGDYVIRFMRHTDREVWRGASMGIKYTITAPGQVTGAPRCLHDSGYFMSLDDARVSALSVLFRLKHSSRQATGHPIQ